MLRHNLNYFNTAGTLHIFRCLGVAKVVPAGTRDLASFQGTAGLLSSVLGRVCPHPVRRSISKTPIVTFKFGWRTQSSGIPTL